jgi:hypothetical protein
MKTILGRDIYDDQTYESRCTHEADVIVTATVLGFSASRIHAGQPFSFDIEMLPPKDTSWFEEIDRLSPKLQYPIGMNKEEDRKQWDKMKVKYDEHLKETQSFLVVVELLSKVLNQNKMNGSLIKDAQSPQWHLGARITGRLGSGMVDGPKRARYPADRMGIQKGVVEMHKPGGYYGRGAYTGMIDDPVNHSTLIKPTQRIVVVDPERWHKEGPGKHGLISPEKTPDINLSPDPKKGMGLLSVEDYRNLTGKRGVIGYVHGMSWAIQECIKCGPWCTPYEMAVGEETTKMASCFACTTYMYAANYQPSSIHLGRGESWHPLPEKDQDPIYTAIAKSLNVRWHAECFNYLRYGVTLLNTASSAMDKGHKEAWTLLNAHPKLKLNTHNLAIGGNLFLDALTVHEADWNRIWRTLGTPGIDAKEAWKRV